MPLGKPAYRLRFTGYDIGLNTKKPATGHGKRRTGLSNPVGSNEAKTTRAERPLAA